MQRVAIPTLSRLQDDATRFWRFFVTGVRSVAFVVIPSMTLLVIAAEEAVLLLLGGQWTEAVPIFRTLAVAGMAQTLSHSNGWLYVCLGRASRQIAWMAFAAPVIVGSFVIGLRWGIDGVATAFAAAVWVLLLPSFWNATRETPVKMTDILGCGVRPVIVSAGGAVLALGMQLLVPEMPVLLAPVLIGLSFMLGAGSVVVTWPRARADLLDIVSLVRGSIGTTAEERL